MICKYRQWRISRAVDAGHPLSAWLRRHVATCPQCAAHHDEQRQVAAALTRAGEHTPEAPPFLRDRVMNAVAVEEAPRAEWLMPNWAKAVAGAAMVAMLAWVLATRPGEQPAPKTTEKENPALIVQQAQADSSKTKTGLPTVPKPHVENALTQLGGSFTKPYTSELQNLKNDLAGTRDFLGDRLAGLSLVGFDTK